MAAPPSPDKADAPPKGAEATTAPPHGYRFVWQLAKRAALDSSSDNLSIVSAGLAFYALSATVPSFAALIAVYGLAADPADVQKQVEYLARLVPADAFSILQGQLNQLVASSQSTLSMRFFVSLGIAFWSASRGIANLINALNIAYSARGSRGFVKTNLMALGLTLAAIGVVLINIVVVVVVPAILAFLGLQNEGTALLAMLRWPLFGAAGIFGLMIFYRYAPDRRRPRWSMTAPGAVTATSIWLLASIGFSVYVSHFGSYDKTYGSLGAVIVLLMWFYLSALALLFGAEVNHVTELMMRERHTHREHARSAPG